MAETKLKVMPDIILYIAPVQYLYISDDTKI